MDLRLRFKLGDRDAFAALVAPHLDTLYTLALRMTGNEAEAADLAQDALVRALEHHDRYQPDRPIRPWLLTVAANLCRDRLRSVWWRRVTGLLELPSAAEPDADALLEDSESDASIRRALGTLAVPYREAVSLYHLQGMTYAEMVEITGVSEAALKQRVRRGTLMLESAYRRLYPERATSRIVGRGA